jgi:hypothetical protein
MLSGSVATQRTRSACLARGPTGGTLTSVCVCVLATRTNSVGQEKHNSYLSARRRCSRKGLGRLSRALSERHPETINIHWPLVRLVVVGLAHALRGAQRRRTKRTGTDKLAVVVVELATRLSTSRSPASEVARSQNSRRRCLFVCLLAYLLVCARRCQSDTAAVATPNERQRGDIPQSGNNKTTATGQRASQSAGQQQRRPATETNEHSVRPSSVADTRDLLRIKTANFLSPSFLFRFIFLSRALAPSASQSVLLNSLRNARARRHSGHFSNPFRGGGETSSPAGCNM